MAEQLTLGVWATAADASVLNRSVSFVVRPGRCGSYDDWCKAQWQWACPGCGRNTIALADEAATVDEIEFDGRCYSCRRRDLGEMSAAEYRVEFGARRKAWQEGIDQG